jgi:hypothetical protein
MTSTRELVDYDATVLFTQTSPDEINHPYV